MNDRIFILICLIIALSSCKKEGISYYVDNYETVESTPVFVEGLDSLFASRICLSDNTMLLQINYGEFYYHLIDLENKKLIKSFGTYEGPESFANPVCFCQFIKTENGKYFVVEELKGATVSVVNLDSLLEHDLFKRKRYNLPPVYLPKSIFFVNDKQEMVGGGGVDGMMFNYSINKQQIRWSNVRPQTEKKYPRHLTDFLYTAGSNIDSEQKIFVVAYVLFNRIDLFNFDGSHIRTIYFGRQKKIEPIMDENGPAQTNINYFWNKLAVNKGLIFLDYRGKELSESYNLDYSLIHVIDLEGNLVKAIRVNQRINFFTVTEDNSMIFALTDKDDGKSNIIQIPLDL